jgi:hypothetical protein
MFDFSEVDDPVWVSEIDGRRYSELLRCNLLLDRLTFFQPDSQIVRHSWSYKLASVIFIRKYRAAFFFNGDERLVLITILTKKVRRQTRLTASDPDLVLHKAGKFVYSVARYSSDCSTYLMLKYMIT